jgi:hypothetical protein
MSILRRIPAEEVQAAASLIWPDKSVADKIALNAVEIISQTYARDFSFFNGKTAKNLVGGLFFILGFRYGHHVKQRVLADILGTSDVTVRASYKSWLRTYPNQFLDVIGQLAQNNAFRYYVLAELNLIQRQRRAEETNARLG